MQEIRFLILRELRLKGTSFSSEELLKKINDEPLLDHVGINEVMNHCRDLFNHGLIREIYSNEQITNQFPAFEITDQGREVYRNEKAAHDSLENNQVLETEENRPESEEIHTTVSSIPIKKILEFIAVIIGIILIYLEIAELFGLWPYDRKIIIY